jgi:hypothetical protein
MTPIALSLTLIVAKTTGSPFFLSKSWPVMNSSWEKINVVEKRQINKRLFNRLVGMVYIIIK